MTRYVPKPQSLLKAPTGRADMTEAPRLRSYLTKKALATAPLAPSEGIQGFISEWDVFHSDYTTSALFPGIANGVAASSRARVAQQEDDATVVSFTYDNIRTASRGFWEDRGIADPAEIRRTEARTPDVLEYWRTHPLVDCVGRERPLAGYGYLRRGNLEDLTLALALFGWVGIGLCVLKRGVDDFTQAALYDYSLYEKGSDYILWSEDYRGKHMGRVFVPAVGLDDEGNILVVLWGRLIAITPDYYAKRSDEAWVAVEPSIMADEATSPIRVKAFRQFWNRKDGIEEVPEETAPAEEGSEDATVLRLLADAVLEEASV